MKHSLKRNWPQAIRENLGLILFILVFLILFAHDPMWSPATAQPKSPKENPYPITECTPLTPEDNRKTFMLIYWTAVTIKSTAPAATSITSNHIEGLSCARCITIGERMILKHKAGVATTYMCEEKK